MAAIEARNQLPAYVAKAAGKGANGGCNNCGSMDHWVRDCPKEGGGKGKGGGKHGKDGPTNPKPKRPARDVDVPPDPSDLSIKCWERTNDKGLSP